MITASSLGLLSRCPGQAVLPYWASTSAAAEEGTHEHQELVPALISNELPDSPRGRALRAHGVAVAGEARAEVATAVDFAGRFARELAPRWPRDYAEVVEGEIPGTADWSTSHEVGELKTGAVWVEHPRRLAQLHHATLARWYATGERVTARLVHVGPPDKGGRCLVRDERFTPSLADLEEWRERILATLDGVARAREAIAKGDRPPLVLGDHCGFCSARLECPALADSVSLDRPAERAIAARAALSRATRAAGLAEALLAAEPCPTLEDGRQLVPVTKHRRQIDAERAIAAMPGLARYARREVTLAALAEYARTRMDWGDTIRARIATAHSRLEEADAITWTTSTRHEIEEHQ